MFFQCIQQHQLVNHIVVHRLRGGEIAADLAVDLFDLAGVVAFDAGAEGAASELPQPAVVDALLKVVDFRIATKILADLHRLGYIFPFLRVLVRPINVFRDGWGAEEPAQELSRERPQRCGILLLCQGDPLGQQRLRLADIIAPVCQRLHHLHVRDLRRAGAGYARLPEQGDQIVAAREIGHLLPVADVHAPVDGDGVQTQLSVDLPGFQRWLHRLSFDLRGRHQGVIAARFLVFFRVE